MKCPVCKEHKLKAIHVEENLPGARCEACNGLWIMGRDYENWLKKLPEQEQLSPPPEELETLDTKVAKICCVCYRLMGKYKVSHDLDFSLERCSFCGGIWFDQNEWEVLKARNLHNDLNVVLTLSHQRLIRDKESRKAMEEMYKEKFGPANYSELLRVRMWLETHPMREEMLSFLRDPDPTKA